MTSCRLSRWRIPAILDCRYPIMGSLKSPCATSYRSSIDTIALNCLVFEKIAFLRFDDRQTDKQMDIIDAWSRSLAVASCGFTITLLRQPWRSNTNNNKRLGINWLFYYALSWANKVTLSIIIAFLADFPKNSPFFAHSLPAFLISRSRCSGGHIMN